MRAYVIVFLEKIGIQLIGVCMPYILVRILVPEEYGVYKTLISYLVIVAYLFYFSLEPVLIRYLPELNGTKHKKTNQFIFFLVFFRIASISSILSIIYIFRTEVLEIIGLPISQIQLKYFLLLIFFTSLTSLIGRAFFTANGWREKLTYIILLKESLKFTSFAVLYFFLDHSNIEIVIKILLALEMITLCVYLYVFIKKVRENLRNFGLKPLGLRFRAIRYGGSNLLWNSFQSMRDTAIDIVIITSLMNPTYSAYYGAGILVPNVLRGFSLFRIFWGIILPQSIREGSTSSKSKSHFEKAFRKFGVLNRLQFAIAGPGIYLIASFMLFFIIEYFGNEYIIATQVTYVILTSVLFILISDVYYMVASILEDNKVLAVAIILSGIINIVLDIFLIQTYGILGVAAATCCSSILTFIFFRIYFAKLNVSVLQNTTQLVCFLLCLILAVYLFQFDLHVKLIVSCSWLIVNYFFLLNKLEKRYLNRVLNIQL